MAAERIAEIRRTTKETDITVKLNLDGTGKCSADTGIVLGSAIKEALGEKAGIRRYGNFMLPMDETLVLCALDLSGRPYYSSDLQFTVPKIGDMDTEMVREFFYAVSYSAAMNLHFHQISGINNHHIAEAAFKAFAKALDQATQYEPRITGVWSTKGSLDG